MAAAAPGGWGGHQWVYFYWYTSEIFRRKWHFWFHKMWTQTGFQNSKHISCMISETQVLLCFLKICYACRKIKEIVSARAHWFIRQTPINIHLRNLVHKSCWLIQEKINQTFSLLMANVIESPNEYLMYLLCDICRAGTIIKYC